MLPSSGFHVIAIRKYWTSLFTHSNSATPFNPYPPSPLASWYPLKSMLKEFQLTIKIYSNLITIPCRSKPLGRSRPHQPGCGPPPSCCWRGPCLWRWRRRPTPRRRCCPCQACSNWCHTCVETNEIALILRIFECSFCRFSTCCSSCLLSSQPSHLNGSRNIHHIYI